MIYFFAVFIDPLGGQGLDLKYYYYFGSINLFISYLRKSLKRIFGSNLPPPTPNAFEKKNDFNDFLSSLWRRF